MSRRHTGIGPRAEQGRAWADGTAQPAADEEVATQFPVHSIKPETAIAELAFRATAAGAVAAAAAVLVRKVAQRI